MTTDPLIDPASADMVPSSPTSSATSSYRAPLGDSFSEISIDETRDTSTSIDEPLFKPERPQDVTEEDKEAALRIKNEANRLFRASDYQGALELYTQSIGRDPFQAAVWCNRAACRLKREEFGLAVSDATEAIKLDSRHVKAYYRRAVAYLSVLKPKLSLADFRMVVKLDPNNATAKAQLDSTVKLVRRLDFEKAIASKDEEPVSIRCKKQLEEGMPVDLDYDGPRLEEVVDPATGKKRPKPTKEFVFGMIEWFKKGKLIPRRYAWQIVLGCQEELLKHESLVEVTIPEGESCDVIGDTHGQFFDVCHLLTLTGPPSETHTLVVNGDYVDRGSWSTEVVLTWFALKWLYPTKCFLNRGNHETSDMNKVYGFEGETKKKYSELTYKLFEECFTALPVATLVTASKPPPPRSDALAPKVYTLGPNGTKRYFVVHGGLFSNDSVGLEEVRKIDRVREKQPSGETTFGEALWTDPQYMPGRGPSKRGVGVAFGPDVTKRWTEANKVTAIIRSHEVRQEGYSLEHDGLCITVFSQVFLLSRYFYTSLTACSCSAPNYVDQVGNLASFCRIADDGELKFTTFKEQPHPDIKPMAYAGGFGAGMMM